MLCFPRNTFSTKEKGWKDEVSLRNSRISSPQVPVRVAPQHCVTKDWVYFFFFCIFLCMHPSFFFIFFTQKIKNSHSRIFILLYPATHNKVTIPRRHWEVHFLSHSKSWTCTKSCTEDKPGDALQPDRPSAQLPSAPHYIAAPLCPLWELLTPLYFCLKTSVCCLCVVWKFFKAETAYCRIVLHSHYQKLPRHVCSIGIHFSAI